MTTQDSPSGAANAPALEALLEERVRLRQEISHLRVYGHDADEPQRRLREIASEIRRMRQQWRLAI